MSDEFGIGDNQYGRFINKSSPEAELAQARQQLEELKRDRNTADRFLETERNNHKVSIDAWEQAEQQLAAANAALLKLSREKALLEQALDGKP